MDITILLTFLSVCYHVQSMDPVVPTVFGDVRGVATDSNLQFLGIPYALPPVGPLRWSKAVNPNSWKPNIYNATSRKPGCPQKYCSAFLPNTSCPMQMSEDCLYLNVWTPVDATNRSGYPVMVFIHGGAFKWGSASTLNYDGKKLAASGKVIVVNMDYRVGILGFLYTGDSPSDANGNYGVDDQRLALQWVQDNIANFGGNPLKVTLFGQSAGAQSTFIHLMSPQTDSSLFRAAIIESAPFSVPYREKEEALFLTNRIRGLLRCPEKDIMSCMRAKSVEEINEVQQEVSIKVTAGKFNEYFEPFGPIIDGHDLTMQPMIAAQQGKFKNVPIVIGTTTEEARLFVYGAWKLNLTRVEYEAALAVIHPSHFEDIEKFYKPEPKLHDYRDDLCVAGTDFLFTCANRNATRNIIQHNKHNVYLYVFDHATVAHGGWVKDSFCEGHVCHAEELGYIFENSLAGKSTLDEQILAESMLLYWTNFAYSGDPNICRFSPALTWPKYTHPTSTTMHFATPKSSYLYDYRSTFCNFWDIVGYEQK